MVENEFLTVDEVAELLKLNQQTVRNMIDRAEMPAVRVGPRRIRIRRADLDAFLDRSATARREPPDVALTERAAWEGFATAMAKATARMQSERRRNLVEALQELATAAATLAEVLKAREESSGG